MYPIFRTILPFHSNMEKTLWLLGRGVYLPQAGFTVLQMHSHFIFCEFASTKIAGSFRNLLLSHLFCHMLFPFPSNRTRIQLYRSPPPDYISKTRKRALKVSLAYLFTSCG